MASVLTGMARHGSHQKRQCGQPTQANPACVVAPLRHIEGERRIYRGLLQPFAPHSHSHYVIGYIRRGMRMLECNGETHALAPGDVVVFNPGDVHGCVQSEEEVFSYDSFVLPAHALGSTALAGPVLRNRDVRAAFAQFAYAMECADGRCGAEEALLALRDALSRDGVVESIASVSRRNREAALRTYAYLRGHMATLLRWETCRNGRESRNSRSSGRISVSFLSRHPSISSRCGSIALAIFSSAG